MLFCRRHRIPLLGFADRIAVVAPIGLVLGRIANFINGELWGRPAPDWLPWAMIFPDRRAACRAIPASSTRRCWRAWCCSPSCCCLARRERLRARFGLLTGAFLCGYAVARIDRRVVPPARRRSSASCSRALTMGQLLSLPMFLAGAWLILRARRATVPAPA